MNDLSDLPPTAFSKEDPSPDALFYEEPRFVTHIDRAAIATVTALYRKLLPPGGVILDLMSSWVSHLPPDVAYGEVIGHGMNKEELAANKRLTRHFVQDLNANPVLPIDSASVDAAAICVSIQYLQQPLAVLRDVVRVLKPGAPVAITFSNRCFPNKAVAIWLALSDDQHAGLVALYLERAGFVAIEMHPPVQGRNPLYAVTGRTPGA
jgi:SAM-dependent methyltransferase